MNNDEIIPKHYRTNLSGTMLLESKNKKLIMIERADFESLNRFKISVNPKGYATINYKSKHYLLHRYLINCPKGLLVDHININPFDNRLVNLRIADKSINGFNRKKSKTNTGEINITFIKNRYSVCLTVKNKNPYKRRFKRFKTIEEAIIYRDLEKNKIITEKLDLISIVPYISNRNEA
jgi:hypothetical protein